jgi:pyrroline-5-carboxylate reductase
MPGKNIAFIGGGNMARSLIGGLISDGYPAERIFVSEPVGEQLAALAAEFGIRAAASNQAAVEQAEAVVLAVKPQTIRPVVEQLGELVRARQALVISIAAGVRIADLDRWLGGSAAIVRAMPNTPALVRSGATALYANSRVDSGQRTLAESLLRSAGLTCWLDNEVAMDAVTAISGSGPAYFFLLMEALEQAGQQLGLPAATARLLVLQTAFGAAKMALESNAGPAELRRQVTSPGGTTEAGIGVLEAADFRTLIQQAAAAAAARADELGRMLGE